jgi:SAM-dependent methyltransferase
MEQKEDRKRKESKWWKDFFNEHYIKTYAHLEATTSKEIEGVAKLLDLKHKAKVLDLCCGYGRHCIELAQKGFKVTGYDLSKFFIERACKSAQALGLKIDFVEGDMRKIPFENQFDAAINMFTSFGFFERDEDDLKVLKGVNKSLKKEGKFLLDTINREFLIRNFQSRRWVKKSGFVMLEESFFDLFSSRIETTRTLIFNDNRRKEYSISLRTYTLSEMIDLLNQSNFTLEGVYGNFELKEYGLDSPRMILVSTKR